MTTPCWNDPGAKLGSMARAALWLVQEVGVGNTFTKSRLREAFPSVGQIDRRVRDLRSYDWVLHSSAEDAALRQNEQRLVKVGVRVWDAVARKEAAPKDETTAKQRAAVLARDDYTCVTCGAAAGDTYPEGGHETARIGVVRRYAELPGEAPREVLVTQCKRCANGASPASISAEEALQRIASLDLRERQMLLHWMTTGRRESSPMERAWNAYRRLPADTRDAVETLMRQSLPKQ